MPDETLESVMQENGLQLISPTQGAARICAANTETLERIFNVILRSETYSYQNTLSNLALLAAHSLPMRHSEAQNVAKAIIVSLKGSLDRWWSNGSRWHSTRIGNSPSVYPKNDGKWIYSSDCPRPHANSTLMHCRQHDTWNRSTCNWTCEQGLMEYTLEFDRAAIGNSRKIQMPSRVGDPSNRWLFEMISGEMFQ